MTKRKILNGHTSEDTAYLVEDYPYGWKRTQIRYWIESVPRKGDRFVRQTLNPNTGKWNKPKKSTYCAVMVMYLNDIDHVKYSGLTYSTDEKEYINFLERNNGAEFNELQLNELKLVKAYIKAYEHVTFECHAVKYRNKITGEISTSVPFDEFAIWEKTEEEVEAEKKNKEVKQQINKLVGYHYHNDTPLLEV